MPTTTRIQPETVLETGNKRPLYQSTRIGRELHQRALTLRAFGRAAGVDHVDVWRYIVGQKSRVGLDLRIAIRQHLRAIGITKINRRTKITVGHSGCAK